jgi:hypothetical protein
VKGAAVALMVLAVACGGNGGPSPTPSASGSPLAQASGRIGAEVAAPPAFPADVPIYPKARLTAAAGFPSTAPTSWGMEWQTLDAVAKVQAYYTDNMNKGDWSLSVTSNAAGDFRATFGRKSIRGVVGTLEVTGASGVTKILLSLVTPASTG